MFLSFLAIDINLRGSSTITNDTISPSKNEFRLTRHVYSFLGPENRFRINHMANPVEAVRDVPLVSPRIEIRTASQNATKEIPVARTPSPAPTRSQMIAEDPRRYNDYDNRPIKPLDEKLLATKLNEYPVDNVSSR